ncbi:YtzI protein [Halobacillus sp. MO56]
MTYTIIMIVSVLIVLGIAAAFGLAVNAGYNYKHTVDPLPAKEDGHEINSRQEESNTKS